MTRTTFDVYYKCNGNFYHKQLRILEEQVPNYATKKDYDIIKEECKICFRFDDGCDDNCCTITTPSIIRDFEMHLSSQKNGYEVKIIKCIVNKEENLFYKE